MTIIDQANTILSLAHLLADFCDAHKDKLEGFYPRCIGSSDSKPEVCRIVQTLAAAKEAAMQIEPDTAKWTMTNGQTTVFRTERMGVKIEITSLETTPAQAAEFPA